MNIVYSNHPIQIKKNSMFLAGPTSRSKDVPSWRPDALDRLRYFYTGTVYVPEWDFGGPVSYVEQVEWEYAHLENCGLVVFWIPRKLPEMPAFTTNVEFGSYVRSKRCLYGRPEDSEKNRYLDWLYTKMTQRVPHTNLNDLLKEAANWLEGE